MPLPLFIQSSVLMVTEAIPRSRALSRGSADSIRSMGNRSIDLLILQLVFDVLESVVIPVIDCIR